MHELLVAPDPDLVLAAELGRERDLDVVLATLGAAGDVARRVRDREPGEVEQVRAVHPGRSPVADRQAARRTAACPRARASGPPASAHVLHGHRTASASTATTRSPSWRSVTLK